jgi:cobalt-zinc-cadmium resistance protein CzcA
MLNKIIEFSVRNKLIIGLFTAALIIFGVYETTKLPIDAVPDITNNQVQVITVAPALGRPILNDWLLFLLNKRAATLPAFTKSGVFHALVCP